MRRRIEESLRCDNSQTKKTKDDSNFAGFIDKEIVGKETLGGKSIEARLNNYNEKDARGSKLTMWEYMRL